MRRKRLVGVGLALVVGLCALGAAAQVTRQEFDALSKQVRMLHADVTLLKLRMRQLKPRIDKLEAAAEAVAPPPQLPKEHVRLKRPRLAPSDVAPQSGTRNDADKPVWTERFTCKNRPIACDWCPYVLDRYETPLGDGRVFPPENMSRFEPPPEDLCPFGITFQVAMDARLSRMTQRVLRGESTPEAAYRTAVTLGLIEDGDPAPWDDGSHLVPTDQMWDDRRNAIRLACGAACGGLCFGCPAASG